MEHLVNWMEGWIFSSKRLFPLKQQLGGTEGLKVKHRITLRGSPTIIKKGFTSLEVSYHYRNTNHVINQLWRHFSILMISVRTTAALPWNITEQPSWSGHKNWGCGYQKPVFKHLAPPCKKKGKKKNSGWHIAYSMPSSQLTPLRAQPLPLVIAFHLALNWLPTVHGKLVFQASTFCEW